MLSDNKLSSQTLIKPLDHTQRSYVKIEEKA
jgi:hypothetical protein